MYRFEKGTVLAFKENRDKMDAKKGEYEKIPENGRSKNEGTTGTTQKTDIEIFKEFILENAGKDGKIPGVEEVTEKTGLSRKQQLNLKAKSKIT
jgi:hypothetical protein